VSLAREVRQEAAARGIEYFVGASLYWEAVAWASVGDAAAARHPAMEAVEIARRVRNPELSAQASFAAAEAIWRRDPQAALRLIEDSVALARAGAFDLYLGSVLPTAAQVRARTGDLPGALAAVQEAMVQNHANGTRLFVGVTLRAGAVVLARLGEAGPAAVLSGAFAAHFPGFPASWFEDEQGAAKQEQALVRHTLGEAAYDAALSRGAAMDEDEVMGYALGEFQRVAALLAEPGARAPHASAGPASGPSGTTAGPPRPG
jgi:hypothetical protein